MKTPSIREMRLASGLVLLLFVSTHLTNHALAIVSLDAMETGLGWFKLIWRNPVSTGLLYGAVLVHFLLGLYALYSRRTLRMPLRELAQLILCFHMQAGLWMKDFGIAISESFVVSERGGDRLCDVARELIVIN